MKTEAPAGVFTCSCKAAATPVKARTMLDFDAASPLVLGNSGKLQEALLRPSAMEVDQWNCRSRMWKEVERAYLRGTTVTCAPQGPGSSFPLDISLAAGKPQMCCIAFKPNTVQGEVGELYFAEEPPDAYYYGTERRLGPSGERVIAAAGGCGGCSQWHFVCLRSTKLGCPN